MKRLAIFTTAALTAFFVSASTSRPGAYSSYATWPASGAVVLINPANQDGLASADVVAALQAAMNDWNTQGGSNFAFTYGGQTNQTTTGYDNKNIVVFRNESTGNIAYTSSWVDSSNRILDSDILIYDPSFRYYAVDGTCTSSAGSYGVYVRDVSVHEFGHMLGLLHSDVATASMRIGYDGCSTTQRSLDSDDIAGVRALYGIGGVSSNTAPSVSISSPASSSSTSEGTYITFSGSASDAQDGNLGGSLTWTSSLVGSLGSGASFARTLPAGTHTIKASVTDRGGLTSSKSVQVTVNAVAAPAPVPAPATTTPTLSASGYKIRKNLRVDLTWKGLATSTIDIYRNGARVTSTTNDGAWTDSMRAGGTYRYKACNSGSPNCSNEASVSF